MRIADILASKGSSASTRPSVVSVAPTDSVTALLAALADRNVGAAVVLQDGSLTGIVSERDVVRGLNAHGPDLLTETVSSIMTTVVATCTIDDRIEQLSVLMTEKRIRHVPVLDRVGALAGIVSIGDVVKSRIEALEEHREQLEAYIAG